MERFGRDEEGRSGRARPAVSGRGPRLSRHAHRHHGRRHDLGCRSAASWRRSPMPAAFGVIACGSMGPAALGAEIAATADLTQRPFGVNLIIMHPELEALAGACLVAARRPCRAGRRLAVGVHDPPAQGGRRQGHGLRPIGRHRQEAGQDGRRRAHHRGHGGPAVISVRSRPRCWRRRSCPPLRDVLGLRRRRHRPRLRPSCPISRWVRPAVSSHALRLRP